MSTAEIPVPRHPGYFRRGGRYTTRVRDRRGRMRRLSGKTIAEVKGKRAAFETDVARGEWRERSRVTFKAYAEEWCDSYTGRTQRGIRPETIADYRKRLEADAIPFLGAMRLADIEPRDIKALAAKVASRRVVMRQGGSKPVSANTVRLVLAPVKALFATAVEEGLIRSNPCSAVRLPRAQVAAPDEEHARALGDEQLAALISAIPRRWQILVILLAQTGLRISEALALTWDDVDLGHRRLHVRRRVYRGNIAPPKSRYGRRTVPLGGEVCRQLWEHRKASGAVDGGLVFASRNGTHLNPANLHGRWLKKATAEAGIPWAGFHTLRHTCATNLFRAGLNAKQVQAWLGHHSPAFTLGTYVHLLSEDLPESPFGKFDGAEEAGVLCTNAASSSPLLLGAVTGKGSEPLTAMPVQTGT